ncbi:hypothetical protein SEUCBS140593_009692 [Sporothrix eucalyptigena]|uniref:Magnesium chelatase n=1 Tax=Sporothrix eucalyptigena TaxID=1812306 RepID=A0ABP0CZP7_9PEZI
MDDAGGDLVDRVHDLSDLELAILLCLVSHEHCVIGTPEDAVKELVDELGLLSNSSGVRSPRSPAGNHAALAIASSSATSSTATPVGAPLVANVVIAKNLNLAPEVVQIQALELMRTHRIFTATAMQAAPRPFLLVAIVAAERGFLWDGGACATKGSSYDSKPVGKEPHMTAHLNDFFSIGHWHDPNDGFLNVEERVERDEGDGKREEDGSDSDSVVRRSESSRARRSSSERASRSSHGIISVREPLPHFSEDDIDQLSTLSKNVRVDMEVLRYQMNVVAFLRLHRAVAVMGPTTGGLSCISPNATKHFEKLAQCLAPLHRLDYVTPALVALAARKTYLHRIRTVKIGHRTSRPKTVHERSMQWGSEKAAVEALLEGISPEDVIDDVLGLVIPPV